MCVLYFLLFLFYKLLCCRLFKVINLFPTLDPLLLRVPSIYFSLGTDQSIISLSSISFWFFFLGFTSFSRLIEDFTDNVTVEK